MYNEGLTLHTEYLIKFLAVMGAVLILSLLFSVVMRKISGLEKNRLSVSGEVKLKHTHMDRIMRNIFLSLAGLFLIGSKVAPDLKMLTVLPGLTLLLYMLTRIGIAIYRERRYGMDPKSYLVTAGETIFTLTLIGIAFVIL